MAGIILVAEVESLTQRLVTTVIENMGFEVKMTQNGSELLDELRAGLVPELLLLDLEMPVMNGIEVLKTLSLVPAEERCPILVMPSPKQDSLLREAIQLGADDFLPKPLKAPELEERIKDFTFELSEAELTTLLKKLQQSATRAVEVAPLRKRCGPLVDFYPITSPRRPMVMSVAKGMSLEVLSKMSVRELKAKVSFYRELGTGWKKIWPRPGRALARSLVSQNS